MPLSAGDRVILYGLSGRADLNGCTGEIKSYIEAKDRYAVQVNSPAADDKPLLLKIANLKLESGVPATATMASLDAAASNREAAIDFDQLLSGDAFAVLRTTLLAASARPGAVSYARQLRGSMPGGKTPLSATVALVASSDAHAPRLVQQACDALSQLCTGVLDMRDVVRGAKAAAALVDALRGAHGVPGVAELSRLEAGAKAKAEAEAKAKTAKARAADPKGAAAAAETEPPRIVDITDGDGEGGDGGGDGGGAGGDGGGRTDGPMAAESAVAGLAAAADEAAAKKEEDEDEGEEEDPLLVTRAALHALTNLANGNLACKTAVVEAGGAAAMAAVMKARGSDEAIAKICVGGLANVGGGDEACVRAMISSGGVDAVVQAVRLFTKASPVSLGDALLALANLACDKKHGAPAVVDAGGFEAIGAAVAAHAKAANDPRLREWAGAALANLASCPSEEVREALAEGGAPRAAVVLMGACGDDEPRTMRYCVGVWAHLGRDSDDGREACCRAGLVEATVRALLATAPSGAPGAAELAEQACRAFATLAFGAPEDRARLREAGAQRALTLCLERFPRSPQVQEMGRALMTELGSGAFGR